MPIRADMSIWRGNNAPPLVWTLPEDVPIDGSDFRLTIVAAGALLLARTTQDGALVLDPALRELSWAYSTAESRLIPPGRIAQYEIERRAVGAEVTELYGYLTGLGGFNTDAAAGDGATLDFSDADNSNLQLMGWI